MPRSVKPWIAKHDDQAIPPRVKLRIVERQGYCCAGTCGARPFDEKLKPVFDHRPALINGGENRESMIEAICPECHARRTRMDRTAAKVTARIKKARLGIKRPSRLAELWKWKKRVLAERAEKEGAR